MCTADVRVFSYVWYLPENKTQPKSFPDFVTTQHTCRNFDDIPDWAERNQLSEYRPDDFISPPRPDLDMPHGMP
jgi:hypothetical protein